MAGRDEAARTGIDHRIVVGFSESFALGIAVEMVPCATARRVEGIESPAVESHAEAFPGHGAVFSDLGTLLGAVEMTGH